MPRGGTIKAPVTNLGMLSGIASEQLCDSARDQILTAIRELSVLRTVVELMLETANCIDFDNLSSDAITSVARDHGLIIDCEEAGVSEDGDVITYCHMPWSKEARDGKCTCKQKEVCRVGYEE